MDFSNLWKHCYRFTHASFQTVYNCAWLTAISSVTVSLHYLPRCLCSTVACRAPIQWFQINPDFPPHNKSVLSCNKNRAVDSGSRGPMVPSPNLKSAPPISCLAFRLLYTSNIALKNVAPLVGFGPPAAKSWRRVRIKAQRISVTNKKYECAYLTWNDNRILI